MCEWGQTEKVRVKIPAKNSYTGKERWDYKPIDKCIAPLVKALNEGGIITTGSCCGHGRYLGSIELEDGRALIIISDTKELKVFIRYLRRWLGVKFLGYWNNLKWRISK